jgi:uncharacterized protein
MRIKISGLARAEYLYDFNEEPVSLGLDEEFISPVQSSIRIMKTSNQILLECKSSCLKKAICDRCLNDFSLKVDGNFKILFAFGESNSKDTAPEMDDMRFLSPEEDFIDLADDIRQMLILNTPMKLLCKEDCAGLCPRCGQDLNESKCGCSIDKTNPKFEELKKLKLE